ncbi:MAG: hypothetical protein M0Q23_08140 [Syntrophales bacterium]|nr:hypothetical protein [Syntrophales bacterium]MDX9922770.1 hypothetical protein [Syntrophales bacterium]
MIDQASEATRNRFSSVAARAHEKEGCVGSWLFRCFLVVRVVLDAFRAGL